MKPKRFFESYKNNEGYWITSTNWPITKKYENSDDGWQLITICFPYDLTKKKKVQIEWKGNDDNLIRKKLKGLFICRDCFGFVK